MMKKVSIIIPVYRVEPFIERCLRSIENQTYMNLECVLVDDCSPDKSAEIAERMIREYDGQVSFKLVHHERNRGLSAARNTGVDVSTGEYIYFLDSDDELPANAIDLLYSWVIKYPEVEIVVGELRNLETDGSVVKDIGYFFDYTGTNTGYIDNREWIVRHCFDYNQKVVFPVNGVNKLIRKDFFVENNLYFKEALIHEDERWLFDLAEHLNKVAFCEDITYLRHITQNSIMTTPDKFKSLSSWHKILSEVFFSLSAPCLYLKQSYCITEAVRQYLSLSVVNTSHRQLLVMQYLELLVQMWRDSILGRRWRHVLAISWSLVYPQLCRSHRLSRFFFRKFIALINE